MKSFLTHLSNVHFPITRSSVASELIYKYRFRQLLMTWHIKFSQLHVCEHVNTEGHPGMSYFLRCNPPPLPPPPSPPQKTLKIKIGFLIIASPPPEPQMVSLPISPFQSILPSSTLPPSSPPPVRLLLQALPMFTWCSYLPVLSKTGTSLYGTVT
jgi:hypothetical protein